jgi:hypothetical protein
MAQGYLFARPKAPDAMTTALQSRTALVDSRLTLAGVTGITTPVTRA